jgi:hypothetical protein
MRYEEPCIAGRRIDAFGLRLVLVGALFVFFDFWVFGFDVIPDFVGYLIMFFGLRRLAGYHPLFHRGQAFTIVNLLLSIPDIYSAEQAGGQASPGWGIYSMISAPLHLIFSLLALHCIIYGIAALAERTGQPELQFFSRRIFIAKAAMGVVSTLSVYAGVLFPGAAVVIAIPVVVVGRIVEIVYLVYLNRARRALDGALLNE